MTKKEEAAAKKTIKSIHNESILMRKLRAHTKKVQHKIKERE